MKKKETYNQFLKYFKGLLMINITGLILAIAGSILLKKNVFLLKSDTLPILLYVKLAVLFIIMIIAIYGITTKKKIGYYSSLSYPLFSSISVLIEPSSYTSALAIGSSILWIFIMAVLFYYLNKTRDYFTF